MKNFLFSFLVFVIASVAKQSHSQITFQKSYGGTNNEWGYFLNQTNDGGFIIAGTTVSFGAGQYDIYLVRITSDGSLLWSKTFGGTNEDQAMNVQQTNDGGYIITGGTKSFGAGNYDIYLIKTASDGSLQWSKAFGGTGYDLGWSVHEANDGGFVIAGKIYIGNNNDVFLVKTASDGSLQWSKTFGGSGDDHALSLQQSNDGGFIITGSTNSFGGTNRVVYLIKTDTDGSLQWTQTYGGAGGNDGYSVQQTNDGGYIIGGSTQSYGAGNMDAYLIKTTSNGALLWTKTFGGTNYDEAYSVQETIDGGYILNGETYSFGAGQSDVYLVKTDSDGNLLWSKTFGGTTDDNGASVQQTNNGGYMIVGSTSSFEVATDIYLIKTDSNGNSSCYETTSSTQINSGGIQGTGGVQGIAGTSTTPSTQTASGGIETVICSSTTTATNENFHDDLFSLLPNPATDKLQITISNLQIEKAELEIFDVMGKLIQKGKLKSQKEEIDISLLEKGVYYLKVSREGKSVVKKFIKM